jgi:hypothetical protein
VLGGYLIFLIATRFRSFENFGTKELADFMTEWCVRIGSLIFWDNHDYENKEPPSELMGVSCHFKDLLNIVMYLNLGFLLLGKMHNISLSVGKGGG